jgi:cysteine-rich repeat protein
MFGSLILALGVSSPAAAHVECGEEYLDQLKPGVFTVCKVADDETTEFPFQVTAEGTGVGSGGTLNPDPILKSGDCVDVYTAPSGAAIPPDTVTITELVPEGYQIDGICVLNLDEDDSGEFHTSSDTYPAGTETIEGQIDANKIGCVAIYSNSREAFCGDAVVQEDEECDDGNEDDLDGCRNDCTLPFCGDGIVDDGELCDDGNDDDLDECRNDCSTPLCGDGILDPKEDCDDGNKDDFDECRNNCTVPMCGDGILDDGEACDDGNNDDGDGCDGKCEVERGDQGCTPGYWKQPHHFFAWTAYDPPGPDYADVFDVDASFDETLLGALNQGGGKEYALGRHASAALLNATNDDVAYGLSKDEVISIVQEAYDTGAFNRAKDELEEENERGCPLGRDKVGDDKDGDEEERDKKAEKKAKKKAKKAKKKARKMARKLARMASK